MHIETIGSRRVRHETVAEYHRTVQRVVAEFPIDFRSTDPEVHRQAVLAFLGCDELVIEPNVPAS